MELAESALAEARHRLYERDGAWFFRARGGQDFGPYADRTAAERALAHFVHRCAPAAGPGGLIARIVGRTA